MTSNAVDVMMTTSLQLMTTAMVMQNTSTEHSDWQTALLNPSVPEGCIAVRPSPMSFSPTNNPDNIVSVMFRANVRKVRVVLLLVFFLIGLPANIINMAIFYKQSLRERVNLLLFFLSLSDELYISGAMIMYAEEFYMMFIIDSQTGTGATLVAEFMINYRLTSIMRVCYASFVFSAIIACERCYCILRPLKYHTALRTRTTAVIIAAVYVIIIGVGVVVELRSRFACVYNLQTGVKMTIFTHSEFYKQHSDLVNYLDSVFFGAGLPVVMMVVLVITTTITTTKLYQIVAWRTDTSSSSSLSPKEIALTKMLIGTAVLLIVCIFPFCLFRLAALFLPEANPGRRQENFYLSSLWIAQTFWYINSSFNIFVYYAVGSRYRETFWEFFKGTGEQEKVGK